MDFRRGALDGNPANASNPLYDGTGTVSAFHLATECTENVTPSWDEKNINWNLEDRRPSAPPRWTGFVYNAAELARDLGYTETQSMRAMGYYDASESEFLLFHGL